MDKPSEAAIRAANDFASDGDNSYIAYGAAFIDSHALALAFEACAAERERAARTAALEQACKAVCSRCAEGVTLDEDDAKWHRVGRAQFTCYAAPIRALMNEVTHDTN